MPVKTTKAEVLRKISGMSLSVPASIEIVVEEQYTPRDWVCQRYRVSLVAVRSNKRSMIALECDLCDPTSQVQNWMMALGLSADCVKFKIP